MSEVKTPETFEEWVVSKEAAELASQNVSPVRYARSAWDAAIASREAEVQAITVDLHTAIEALQFYGTLGACACTKSCECGHCKAHRLTAHILGHPGTEAVNASVSNAKFLAAEWGRHITEITGLREQIKTLREALVSAKKWIPVGGGGAFEMHEQIDAALAKKEKP